jgi:hypothetical protein
VYVDCQHRCLPQLLTACPIMPVGRAALLRFRQFVVPGERGTFRG